MSWHPSHSDPDDQGLWPEALLRAASSVNPTCTACGAMTYHLIGGTIVCPDCDGIVWWPRFHKSALYDWEQDQ